MKNQKLIKLMKDYDLRVNDVARILNVSPMSVRIWRCKSERSITENNLRLLELELKK
jgi:hypothetical protein